MIQDDETKELKIYFNPKTKLWEGERTMLARLRRRHVVRVCVSICLIALGNLIMQAGGSNRWTLIIGGLIICAAMVNAISMARENLEMAHDNLKTKGARDAHESR